jgi:hypothetical protein
MCTALQQAKVSELVAALVASEGLEGALTLVAKAGVASAEAADRHMGYAVLEVVEEVAAEYEAE